MHTVKENELKRSFYSYDGFLNHSCDFNIIFSQKRETIYNNVFQFDSIAYKDIKEGDELTCNYFHFDYECDGHVFECKCGYKNCYGLINGFKNLTLEQQIEIMPFADNDMLENLKKK